MLRPKIHFNEQELDIISEKSCLSRLEILGLLEIMNQFTYSDEHIKRYEYDEMMGRHVY